MRRATNVLAVALMATLSASASADDVPKKLVAFNADARVEVDAQGKVVRVQAAADLPPAIRTYIEQRVSGWTFSPPKRGDQNAAAASYLTLGACAIPTASGYRMGLDLKRTGPRPAQVGGWSNLDLRAIMRTAGRLGWNGGINVHYIVDKDGSARVESIDVADRLARQQFTRPLQEWIGRMRFEPEEFGGHAVATKQDIQLDIIGSGGPSTLGGMRAARIERATKSPECAAAAASAEPEIVTVDSVVQVLDAS